MMLAQQQARMQNQGTQESKRTGMGLSRRDEESEKIRQSIASSEINYDQLRDQAKQNSHLKLKVDSLREQATINM